MSRQVTFDYSKAGSFISEEEIGYMKKLTLDAKETLVSKTGAGNDFLGWIDLPVDYDKEEFARIKAAAKKIQSDSDVLLVIGIGGSYLGARAAIEFLRHSFYNNVSKEIRKTPEIYYCGNNLSGTYLSQLIDVIGDRDFSVNIISKSGTTTEPAIAFRVFKEMLEKRTGLPVVMWDERLTTVEANRTLMESKVRRENRSKYVDMIAAVFILQGYLDSKANPGTV